MPHRYSGTATNAATGSNTSNNQYEDVRRYKLEPNLYFILDMLLVFGIAFIIIQCFYNGLYYTDAAGQIQKAANSTFLFSSIGVGLLIAGASLAIGGLMGFLFGIPKVLQNDSMLPEGFKNKNTIFIHNDNLVQISDWLTKIIVGVGLTQLYNIGPALLKVGAELQDSFGTGNWGRNVAISIILYYASVGFMYVYIWTRIYFLRRLREMDEEWKERATRAEEEVKVQDIQIKKTEEEKKEIININNSQVDELNAIYNTAKNAPLEIIKENFINRDKRNMNESDPQKGKWGGKTEDKGRKVSATVKETMSSSTDWYVINLLVESTNPATNPLLGQVDFYLHSTFSPSIQTVEAINGLASLQLYAYGAFTVGISCDNGDTKLEIDLSQLPDAPQVFKDR